MRTATAPHRDPLPDAAPDRPVGPDEAEPDGSRPGLERLGLAIGALVVVGFAAATIGRRSLWLDEAYTVAAIHHPWLSLTRTHGTMGLYYVLMWLWGQVGVAAWWLRIPSVLAALGTLVVVRGIARRIGGSVLAACAVPLVALQPMFELKAVEARSYSLMILLVALGWDLVLRGLDDDRRRWPVLLAVVAAAGALTQGLFVVHLLPIAALAATTDRRRRLAVLLGPAVVLAGGVALALRTSGAHTVGTYVPGGPFQWLVATLDDVAQGPPLAQVVVIIGLVVGGRMVVGGITGAADAPTRTVRAVPLVWAVGPPLALALLSLAVPLYNPRYLAPIAPALGLVLAQAVTDAPRLVHRLDRGAPIRAGAAAVLGLALLAGLVQAENPRQEDWRSAAALVADRAEPADALLFANLDESEPEQHRPPFEVAWAEAADRGPAPTVVSSDRPLGEARRYEDDRRTPAAMAAAARRHARVWVVGGHGGGSVAVDDLLDDPAFDGLVLVDEWSFDQTIDVALYQWEG